jgi:hypothetical protein
MARRAVIENNRRNVLRKRQLGCLCIFSAGMKSTGKE